ncbi:G-type lectin S-receptor-like serine/threonine-protein kinase SD2-5 isoform X2 [Papaver somniferum]|uniref:G-type lectin S-receptor-like serine/threonine-protein kinase SD2-5 isoform X2 n=1 Tax=Papaver somniferum TaxID=3469 RepID=UPI000E6FEE31|nr:G-type lectin S-receptor-like serine/threonine-protein kinase SD2-5 isoform X2 [Papaver somniferum]
MSKYYWIFFTICFHFIAYKGNCKSDIPLGYKVTIPIPSDNNAGFTGRAFLMEPEQITVPSFKVALSVEASFNGSFSCSLQIFLGEFKVWDSGHASKFYPQNKCMLEFTEGGVLLLRGSERQIGWTSGTSGQGVERLQLLRIGNLVLLDAMDRIKWQSFEFPTNVILWGQEFNFSTRLTSSVSGNSTMFYSFEIQNNRIGLYLNSGKFKYSYWEFSPTEGRNIVSAELGSTGLKLFDQNHRKFAQISSRKQKLVRFLALSETNGNLGLYHYSLQKRKFEASFKAMNEICDFPVACGPYSICTLSNTCTCIQFSEKSNIKQSDCNVGFSGEFCGKTEPVEMIEIKGVGSILKSPQIFNVRKEVCLSMCIDDCACVALLYSDKGVYAGDARQRCVHYGLARGLKQMEEEEVTVNMLSYWAKVPKGIVGAEGKISVLKRWLLIMGGVVDVLIILLVMGGSGYYYLVIRKRRTRNENPDT